MFLSWISVLHETSEVRHILVQSTDNYLVLNRPARDKAIHVRVTSEELEYLNQVANLRGYKLSGFIREALQRLINEGNPS